MGLLSLLPGRHADFELALTIHDLQNVPLVSGTFSVEWKFKSSKAHPELVLQDKSTSLASSSKSHHSHHHHHQPHASISTASSSNPPAPSSLHSSSHASTNRPRSVSSTHSSSKHPPHPLRKIPTSTSFSTTLTTTTTNSSSATNSTTSDSNNEEESTTNSNSRSSSDSSASASSSSPPSSASSPRLSSLNKSRTRSRLDLKTARRQALSTKNEHGHAFSSSSKGQTEGVEIRDHACTWFQEVRSQVRIAVGAGKELGVLGEREVRVVVHQHLSFHESEKSARLGQLVLNLAEFAGKGKVTRRYLLDEGKTNATIKLSIELVQIGGQTSWISIPVSKGQAAGAGLENLVGNHTRPMGDVHASPASPALSTTSLASKQQTRPSSSNQTPSSSHPPSTRNSSQNLTSLLTPNAALLNNKSTSSVSFCSSVNTNSNSNGSTTPNPLSGLLPTATASPSSSSLNTSNITLPLHNPLKQTPKPPSTRTSSPSRAANPSAATPATFFAPTSTESIIESIFNPRPSTISGPFFCPMPPPISRTSTASSAYPTPDSEDGSYIVVGGNGKAGSPLKQKMSANNLNHLSSSTRKLVVPSAWKKKGGRGREVSGGSLGGAGGGEEMETASIASGVSMSRAIGVGGGGGGSSRSA